MYVSKPVQAITGYVLFSERIPLVRWTDEYKDDPEVLLRIEECMKKRKYAARILSYIDTVPIELASIREAITDFIIPQSPPAHRSAHPRSAYCRAEYRQ